MNTIRFRIPEPDRTPAASFTSLPAYVREELKKGFVVLARLESQHYPELLKLVRESFVSRVPIKKTEAASKVGASPDEASALMTTAGMVCFTLSATGVTPVAFVDAGMKAGVIAESNKDALLSFSETVVKDSEALSEALQISQMSTEVLPLLGDFEVSVDVRLGFGKERISTALPIVLVRLSTDRDDQRMYFQLTRHELEEMIENLQEALVHLQEAETWTAKNHPFKG